VNAEGRHLDPYGLHEQRWFSDGQPTDLVRDEGVTSHDEPPSDEPPVALVEPPAAESRSDVHRADEAATGEPYDAAKIANAGSAMGDLTMDRPWPGPIRLLRRRK
jgi:hypothetical protein